MKQNKKTFVVEYFKMAPPYARWTRKKYVVGQLYELKKSSHLNDELWGYVCGSENAFKKLPFKKFIFMVLDGSETGRWINVLIGDKVYCLDMLNSDIEYIKEII